jgi:hypothetical protein
MPTLILRIWGGLMRKIGLIAILLILCGCDSLIHPVYKGARFKPVTFSDLTDEEKKAVLEGQVKAKSLQPPTSTTREDIERLQNQQKQVLRSMGIPTPP